MFWGRLLHGIILEIDNLYTCELVKKSEFSNFNLQFHNSDYFKKSREEQNSILMFSQNHLFQSGMKDVKISIYLITILEICFICTEYIIIEARIYNLLI